MGSAKQPQPFNPRKAALLDDPERERWLPTDALLHLLDVPERARILDYGTGTARYAIAAAQRYPDARVTAFDTQEPMLEIARERVRESRVANLAVAGPSAPASAERFDRILALNVLHEVEDSDLGAIRGFLEPNGFALFVDWNASIPREFGPPAGHTYTEDEALHRLARAGLAASAMPEPRFPYHFVLRAR